MSPGTPKKSSACASVPTLVPFLKTLGWGFEPQNTRLGGGCAIRATRPEHGGRQGLLGLRLSRPREPCRPVSGFCPRPGTPGEATDGTRARYSSSGAFSRGAAASPFAARLVGLGFVAVAFFRGFVSAGVAGSAAALAASASGGGAASGFVSFFSYSSTNWIVFSSVSSRRSATTRNLDTNHFSSVLQTSGSWISDAPSSRWILNCSPSP